MSSLVIALSVALAQAPAAAPAAPPAAVSTEPAPAPAPAEAAKVTHWYDKFSVDGFARVSLGYTFPLRTDELIGSNGGFRVAELRLGLGINPVERLTIYTSVELAAPLIDPNDPLAGRRIIDLRDAFIEYALHDAFVVKTGQFRAPYDAELLMLDQQIPFISRSVLANGLNPPEGYVRAPLVPDRQVGLQVGSKRLGSRFGFRYAAGVFNGGGLNALVNSNNVLSPVARVEVDFAEKVTLGLNASYAVLTQGPRTARLNTNQLSYGADLTAKIWRLEVMAVLLARRSSYSWAGLPDDSAFGALGQVHYVSKLGLEAAVRVAWYEPSTAMLDDQVTEIAAMVGWRPFEMPFRILLQYTHRAEEARVSIPNDSVDLMIHAVW